MRPMLLAAALLIPVAAYAQTPSPATPPAPSAPQAENGAPPPPGHEAGWRPGHMMHDPMMRGPMMGGPMMRGPMMRGMEHGMMRWHHPDTFGLLWRAPDLALTPADVTVIAKAMLLRHGNHNWSVIDVQPEGDAIGFAFALKDGAVIARFVIDPHSGRIERTG